MDNVFKQTILLIILSIAAIFLQQQLSQVLHYILVAHNQVAHLLSYLFGSGPTAMAIRGIIALIVVPVICGGFFALIIWLVKHISMPHTMGVIWTVWLVMLVTILAKAA